MPSSEWTCTLESAVQPVNAGVAPYKMRLALCVGARIVA